MDKRTLFFSHVFLRVIRCLRENKSILLFLSLSLSLSLVHSLRLSFDHDDYPRAHIIMRRVENQRTTDELPKTVFPCTTCIRRITSDYC